MGVASSADGKMDPMHQFEVQTIFDLPTVFGIDTSFTNASLWMVISVAFVTCFTLAGSLGARVVPGRLQSLNELAYNFIGGMVDDMIGTGGRQFFPLIFTLFMFILTCNMMGMMPYSFTVTSHIIVTFALASLIFITVTLVGFAKHGIGFLKLFAPSGVPLALLPLLILIECVSFLTRPISLSVRLFANMMAGHTMLKVFAGFVVSLSAAGLAPMALAPFVMMIAFTGLELLIAFLQAYVFVVLSCIYLNEAVHLDH